MLKDWKHSGFSIESETRLFSKADREALGEYVVRNATCSEKIHYDPETDTVTWTTSPKGLYKGRTETFRGFEFVDQLVGLYHLVGFSLSAVMVCMQEKSGTIGNSARVSTVWYRNHGNRLIRSRRKQPKKHRQKQWIRPRFLMPSQSSVDKVGRDCCRRSTKWIHLSVPSVTGPCRGYRLSKIQRN